MISPPPDCTFSARDWQVLASFWYPVAFSHEIVDRPVAATLLDLPLVIWRTASGMQVALDRCPHRGVPLSKGWLHGEHLVCCYHGFHYDGAGRCVLVPGDPEATIPGRLRLHTLPVREAYGLVWTTLSGDPHSSLPQFPEWEDPAYTQFLPQGVEMNTSAGRQVEGFLDVAHFAWVHTQSFGDANNPGVPRYEVEPTEHGLRVPYYSTVSNYPKGIPDPTPAGYEWLRLFEVFFPFTARLTVFFPEQGRLCILNAASPVSARRTKLFCPICRNFDRDAPPEATYAFNHQVFAEDQAMVEAQYPLELPLDLRAEVHVGSDRTSIAYRQGLLKLGLGVA